MWARFSVWGCQWGVEMVLEVDQAYTVLGKMVGACVA